MGTAIVIDMTTVLSLLSTICILGLAYGLSSRYLPSQSTTTKTRILFIWHAFDALIHIILEGSYLWGCFFSYSHSTAPSPFLPPGVHFLGRHDRVYGAEHGTSPFSALWREYAKADSRWLGTDLTVISLELLTVGVMAPIAIWICVCLSRSSHSLLTSKNVTAASRVRSEWFWMTILATGELYGGFMTFAPEWLSGSPSLDTSNALYLWVYLFFFNTIWVWVPLWVLYECYATMTQSQLLGTSKME